MIDIKKQLPYLTAIIGFSIAWLVKPSLQEPASNGALESRNGNLIEMPQKSARSSDKPALPQRGGDPANAGSIVGQPVELPEELVRMRESMATQLSQGLALRDHGFIRRMTELLGLEENQQVAMLRLIEKKREAFHAFHASSEMPTNLLERAEKAEADYHQALGQILDQNQVAKYNDYKKQQARNRAVANAKTSFAEVLKNVDLSEDQQAAAEVAIRDTSLANQQTFDKTNALQEAYETMGFGSAAGPMATSAAANFAIETAADRARTLQDVLERRKLESSSQLEALRPILTSAQWEHYKSILDAKDRSFYMSIEPFMSSAPVDPSILNPNADN
jgi:hypothetical protein